jgi:4-amino-4-deoxy-L-arabinose transferase-like glycosyltransferase
MTFKRAFIVSSVLMLFIMLSVSDHYGISWDEKVQSDYGENALKFYTSGGSDTSYVDHEKLLHYYGAFVEIICAAVNKITDGDKYDVRHFIIAIFGFLGMLFTGFCAKEIGGWRAGLVALLFVFFTPIFFGHSMYNSKDIPFATCYIAAVYFLILFIKQFPGVSARTMGLLSLFIGLSISIRIGGLLLIAYVFLVWFAKSLHDYLTGKDPVEEHLMRAVRSLVPALIVGGAGYFAGMLFWPYGLSDPFSHPFEALKLMSQYEAFDSWNLFSGRWIHRWEIPWNYLPQWMWITLPLFIHASLFMIPFLFTGRISAMLRVNRWQAGMLCFAALFPLLYIIVKDSNVYDSWRHVLFVYPPFAAIAAVAWTGAVKLLRSRLHKAALVFVVVLLIAQPAVWMLRNHPFESFYFNPLIGGIDGAFRKYEIDYYGTSIRQAVEWIAENADTTGKQLPVRVRNYFGETESTEHFVKKYKHLKYVMVYENSLDWDYSIVLPTQAKTDSLLLVNWPPQGTVYQAFADSTPIFAVVKNYRTPETFKPAETMYNSNDVAFLIAESVRLYNTGDFASCIAVCERALSIDPSNIIAYNNKCSALNQVMVFEEAIAAAEAGLAIDPGHVVLKNNYQEAVAKAKEAVSPAIIEANYIAVSLACYQFGQYKRTVYYCEKALEYNPRSAVAYNNICSAYNSLGKYKEAIAACEKGLELDPGSSLLRNNLNLAKASR